MIINVLTGLNVVSEIIIAIGIALFLAMVGSGIEAYLMERK